MKRKITWRKFHKWGALLAAVFILMFCLSGIVLNHRVFFADYNISRRLLPESYRLNRFNNGVIKGTIELSSDTLLAYGNVGVWLTDRNFERFKDFNKGFPSGVDKRSIKNVVRTPDGTLWCAAQFAIYRHDGNQWEEVAIEGNEERISDITLSPDSSTLIVLSRSKIFNLNPATLNSGTHVVASPSGEKPKVTLFKTFWMLHSGELFGTAGRIVVDIVAIVLILLCITGIILFCIPYRIKWRRKHKNRRPSHRIQRCIKCNYHFHDKIGYVTILLTLIVAFTGMCLRPPLMIPLVIIKTSPMPNSSLDSDNFWHDKMRAIRWDDDKSRWLVSTSEGFLYVNQDFSGSPVRINNGIIPPVSPMGITVFEKADKGKWLVGSFSGLFVWDMEKGKTIDFISGLEHGRHERRYATGDNLIAGISHVSCQGEPIIFDYATGSSKPLPEMDGDLRNQPMSLWNTALELHVGRCYAPFLGPFSSLFVFLFGLLLTVILISGLIIHRRHAKTHQRLQ